MKLQKLFIKKLSKILILTIALTGYSVNATIVQFETNMGNFEVNLYDNDTPLTVANFLAYVDDGDYSNSVFHRAVPGFIIQGGGFKLGDPLVWPLGTVNSNPTVNNEPIYSNVRGTIAMAKLGGDPNSATNQWFINIDNSNASNLDNQNGGFTVFGQVTGDGMAVVDTMMALPRFNFGGALTDIPLQNFTAGNDPDATNLLIITSIQVIDATMDTASGLTRPLTTRPPDAVDPGTPTPQSSSGAGASIGLLFILIFGGLVRKFV